MNRYAIRRILPLIGNEGEALPPRPPRAGSSAGFAVRATTSAMICAAAITACAGDRDLRMTRQERIDRQLERQAETDEIIQEQRRLTLPPR